MEIEDRLARGRGNEYREVLAEEALVIAPGAVLDKAGCVAAMDSSPGWDDVALADARLIESQGYASVVHRFEGVRGSTTYSATLSSTYRMPARELLLHQQTPDA